MRRITGDLTVRGVTRQVTADFGLTGSGRDPQGSQVAAFTGRTVVDRRDRGVSRGPRHGRPERDAGVPRRGGTPVLTRAGARYGPGPGS
ncbi:YceI family protein [Streptomyces massasporeus]|uniref:YceI family protein n=1 Tax=Streptomyces massasporeus TaxID=67324 RepID=UPI00381FC043